MLKRTIALTAAGTLVAGTAATVLALPAHADGPERDAHGQVAGAAYEISIDKERKYEVDADIDGVAANSTWKMVVHHNGTKVGTRTADAKRDDGRWEVDFRDVRSADKAGKDTFKVKLVRTDGPGKVTRTLSFPR